MGQNNQNKSVKQNLFADMLKKLRETNKVSQEELAMFCGIKRQQVSNYELGISRPSLEIIEKIADFFDVTVDYLLCRGCSELMENNESRK